MHNPILIHMAVERHPPPRRGGRAEAPDPDHQAPDEGLTPPSAGTASCMRFASGSWELYAETFGDPADPPVVLLHGAGNSMMAWDAELCEAIAGRGRLRRPARLARRRAVRPASRGAAPYSLHDRAGDVVALLDALELPAATLAGVSQGGMTAQIVAVEHPARVSGLVLISTTPSGDELPGPVEGLFAGGPEPPDWADRAAVVRYLVEVERPYGAGALRRGADDAHRRADASTTPTTSRGSSVSVRARKASRRCASASAQIRVPTVVVHGTDDPMFPLEHGRALAAAIPGARLVELDGFGHATLPRDEWPLLVETISSLPAPPSSAAADSAASVSAQAAGEREVGQRVAVGLAEARAARRADGLAGSTTRG